MFEVGSIFAKLGGHFDRKGFEEADAAYDKMSAKFKNDVNAKFGISDEEAKRKYAELEALRERWQKASATAEFKVDKDRANNALRDIEQAMAKVRSASPFADLEQDTKKAGIELENFGAKAKNTMRDIKHDVQETHRGLQLLAPAFRALGNALPDTSRMGQALAGAGRGGGGLGGTGIGAGGGLPMPPLMPLAIAALMPAASSLFGGAGALLGSAGSAAMGGGALGLGAMAPGIVGLGSMLSVLKPMGEELKSTKTAWENYQKAVDQYGESSKQAQAQQEKLNVLVKEQGPEVLKAVQEIDKLGDAWRNATKPAQAAGAGILSDFIGDINKNMGDLSGIVNKATVSARKDFDDFFKQMFSRENLNLVKELADEFSKLLGPGLHTVANLLMAAGHTAVAVEPDLLNIAHDVEQWSDHILDLSRNQGLMQGTLSRMMGQLESWGRLAQALFRLIRDTLGLGAHEGQSMVDSMTKTVTQWDKWVNSNPDKVQRFYHDSASTLGTIMRHIGEIVKLIGHWIELLNTISPAFNAVLTIFLKLLDTVTSLLAHNAALRDIVGAFMALAAIWKGISFLAQITGVGTLIKLYQGLAGAATEAAIAEEAAAAGGVGLGAAGGAAGGAGRAGVSALEAGGAGVAGGVAGRSLLSRAGIAGRLGAGALLRGAGIMGVTAIGEQLYQSATGGNKGGVGGALQQAGGGAIAGAGAGFVVGGPVGAAVGGLAGAGAGLITSALGFNVFGKEHDYQKDLVRYSEDIKKIGEGANFSKGHLQDLIKTGNDLAKHLPQQREEIQKTVDTLRHIVKSKDEWNKGFNEAYDAVHDFTVKSGTGIEGLKDRYDTNMRLIASTVGRNSKAGREMMAENTNQMIHHLEEGMEDGVINVKKGTNEMLRVQRQYGGNSEKNMKETYDSVQDIIYTSWKKGQISTKDAQEQIKKVVAQETESMRQDTDKRYDQLNKDLKKKYDAGLITHSEYLEQTKTLTKNKGSDVAKNMEGIATDVQTAMSYGVIDVQTGIKLIMEYMTKAFQALGVDPGTAKKLASQGWSVADVTAAMNTAATSQQSMIIPKKERGGYAPGAEFGLGDLMTLVDPLGRPRAKMAGDEGIFTRHQMPYVEAGLQAIGFGGADDLWNKVDKPHGFAQGGKMNYQSGGSMSHYQRLVAAMNRVDNAHFPYHWGGGHENPSHFEPFDCSGAVSYVVQQAGYKVPTSVAGNIGSWNFPSGPGTATIYYSPKHTFMRVGQKYWGTHGSSGAGWFDASPGYTSGYSAVHLPDLGGTGQIPKMVLKGTGEIVRLDNNVVGQIRDQANNYIDKYTAPGAGGGGDAAFGGSVAGPRVTASYYTDWGRSTASGKIAGPTSWWFAELSNPPSSHNWSALGGLPMHTMIDVSYAGRTVRVPREDVGAGGAGIGGTIRAIDLTDAARKALGMPGLAIVTWALAGKGSTNQPGSRSQVTSTQTAAAPHGGMFDHGGWLGFWAKGTKPKKKPAHYQAPPKVISKKRQGPTHHPTPKKRGPSFPKVLTYKPIPGINAARFAADDAQIVTLNTQYDRQYGLFQMYDMASGSLPLEDLNFLADIREQEWDILWKEYTELPGAIDKLQKEHDRLVGHGELSNYDPKTGGVGIAPIPPTGAGRYKFLIKEQEDILDDYEKVLKKPIGKAPKQDHLSAAARNAARGLASTIHALMSQLHGDANTSLSVTLNIDKVRGQILRAVQSKDHNSLDGLTKTLSKLKGDRSARSKAGEIARKLKNAHKQYLANAKKYDKHGWDWIWAEEQKKLGTGKVIALIKDKIARLKELLKKEEGEIGEAQTDLDAARARLYGSDDGATPITDTMEGIGTDILGLANEGAQVPQSRIDTIDNFLKSLGLKIPTAQRTGTAADQAAAAYAMFQAFQEARASLFSQYGSNFVASGINPFTGNAGVGAGMQYYGAAAGVPATGGGSMPASGGGTTINIEQNFAGPPPDPHTHAAGLVYELQAQQ